MIFIKVSKIKTGHIYRPKRNTALNKIHLLEKNGRVEIGVSMDKEGFYTLIRGIDAFNCYSAIGYQETVPCYIYEEKSSLDSALECLQRCFLEKTHYKIRFDYIMLLQKNFNLSPSEIASKTGIDVSEINKYEIDSSVPKWLIDEIIEQNMQSKINKISKDKKIPSLFKPFLYERALSPAGLTDKKIKWLKLFFKMDFSPTYKEFELYFRDIIDLESALAAHWEKLLFQNDDTEEYENPEKENGGIH